MNILTGIQPTGQLHLGNYLGSIRPCIGVDGLYMIADLHAVTGKCSRDNIINTACFYLASGIGGKIFVQSDVRDHAELAWILGCHTPIGWLNRMTQFKSKKGGTLGLYSYPVLMAADILLYKTTHVPVGEDQKQHVELARDIAGAFNRAYNQEFFPLPEPIIQKQAARIMSLRDGTKKMSKSDESDYSRINLTDDADAIADKIRRATPPSLYGIYLALTDEEYTHDRMDKFKSIVTELLVSELLPIQKEAVRIKDNIDHFLDDGANYAIALAAKTMRDVRDIVGMGR